MNDAKIIGGMADALWFHAWGLHSPKKACPPTPPGADKAARDLLKLYLEINEALNLAALVAKSSDFTAAQHPTEFGHRLAMHALRTTGGGFVPYHGPQLTLMEPNFEITYDGDNLVWDGSDSREWEDNPRRSGGRLLSGGDQIRESMAISLWRRATDVRPAVAVISTKTVEAEQDEARKAASDLAKLYESANGATLDELFKRSGRSDTDRDRHHFGWDLADAATDPGSQARYAGIAVPTFSIKFEGKKLKWQDGRVVRNPRNPFIGYDADKKAIYGPDVRIKPSDAARLEPMRGYSQVLAAFDSAGKSIGWVLVEDLGYANAAEWMKATGKA